MIRSGARKELNVMTYFLKLMEEVKLVSTVGNYSSRDRSQVEL